MYWFTMLRLVLPGIVMLKVIWSLLLMLIMMGPLVWHVALAMGRIGKPHHRSAAAHCPIIRAIVLPLRSSLVLVRTRSVSVALVAVAAVAMRRLVLVKL